MIYLQPTAGSQCDCQFQWRSSLTACSIYSGIATSSFPEANAILLRHIPVLYWRLMYWEKWKYSAFYPMHNSNTYPTKNLETCSLLQFTIYFSSSSVTFERKEAKTSWWLSVRNFPSHKSHPLNTECPAPFNDSFSKCFASLLATDTIWWTAQDLGAEQRLLALTPMAGQKPSATCFYSSISAGKEAEWPWLDFSDHLQISKSQKKRKFRSI